MPLFSALTAWFSSSVPHKYRTLWLTHGGSVSSPQGATYLFSRCADSDAFAVASLLNRALLHPLFIEACVVEGGIDEDMLVVHMLPGQGLTPTPTVTGVLENNGISGICQSVTDDDDDGQTAYPTLDTLPKMEGPAIVTGLHSPDYSVHFKKGVPAEVRRKILEDGELNTV